MDFSSFLSNKLNYYMRDVIILWGNLAIRQGRQRNENNNNNIQD